MVTRFNDFRRISLWLDRAEREAAQLSRELVQDTALCTGCHGEEEAARAAQDAAVAKEWLEGTLVSLESGVVERMGGLIDSGADEAKGLRTRLISLSHQIDVINYGAHFISRCIDSTPKTMVSFIRGENPPHNETIKVQRHPIDDPNHGTGKQENQRSRGISLNTTAPKPSGIRSTPQEPPPFVHKHGHETVVVDVGAPKEERTQMTTNRGKHRTASKTVDESGLEHESAREPEARLTATEARKSISELLRIVRTPSRAASTGRQVGKQTLASSQGPTNIRKSVTSNSQGEGASVDARSTTPSGSKSYVGLSVTRGGQATEFVEKREALGHIFDSQMKVLRM